MTEYNGHTYFITKSQVNPSKANQACQDFIVPSLSTTGIFPSYVVSGYDLTSNGVFVYNSGPNANSPLVYSNWVSGQPSPIGLNRYISVYTRGQAQPAAGWTAVKDINLQYYLCEFDSVQDAPVISYTSKVPGTGGHVTIKGTFPLGTPTITIGNETCKVSSATTTTIVCQLTPQGPVTPTMPMVITINGEVNAPYSYTFDMPKIDSIQRVYGETLLTVKGDLNVATTISYADIFDEPFQFVNGELAFELKLVEGFNNSNIKFIFSDNGLIASYNFQPCPASCNGANGECTRNTGICTCSPGFFVPDCMEQKEPVITNILGTIGGGGGQVTFVGRNFYADPSLQVTFGSIPCGAPVVDPLQLNTFTCSLSDTKGPFTKIMPVWVTVNGMHNLAAYNYTFASPVISTITTTNFGVSTAISITGINLSKTKTTVTYGGKTVPLAKSTKPPISNFWTFQYDANIQPPAGSLSVDLTISSNGLTLVKSLPYKNITCDDPTCSLKGICNLLIGQCLCQKGFGSNDCSMPLVNMDQPLPFVQVTFNNVLQFSMLNMLVGRRSDKEICGIVGPAIFPLTQTIDHVSENITNVITLPTSQFNWEGLSTKTSYDASLFYYYEPGTCNSMGVVIHDYFDPPEPVQIASTDPLVASVRAQTNNPKVEVFSITFQAFDNQEIDIELEASTCHYIPTIAPSSSDDDSSSQHVNSSTHSAHSILAIISACILIVVVTL
eukprot:gene10761-12533_t